MGYTVHPYGAIVTAAPFRRFACLASRFILCGMYIPRPAKLLFTVDDGGKRYLGSNGDSVTPWTRLCVERMLAWGFKATEQWVSQQSCILPDSDWQYIPFTMPPSAQACLQQQLVPAQRPVSRRTRAILRWAWKPASYASCTPTAASSTSIRISTSRHLRRAGYKTRRLARPLL